MTCTNTKPLQQQS